MTTRIPVIPYEDPDQALDDEMQKQIGELGKEVILKGAKDSSGRTLFQNLLESTKGTSQKGLEFLSNFIWGDPNTTLDGAPMPGGYNQDYLNLPYETKKRFDESMMN